ncbi:hypothetical protein AX16_006894 [Volvariella volvacea WC 439]|nr:hypothetical protein AX16_006894 [Volvariella volvacea WC 439]
MRLSPSYLALAVSCALFKVANATPVPQYISYNPYTIDQPVGGFHSAPVVDFVNNRPFSGYGLPYYVVSGTGTNPVTGGNPVTGNPIQNGGGNQPTGNAPVGGTTPGGGAGGAPVTNPGGGAGGADSAVNVLMKRQLLRVGGRGGRRVLGF